MYVSGELYQSYCKWNIDNRYKIRKWDESIKEGDTVFMKYSDITKFLSDPPPKKVNIIIHNSDETFEYSDIGQFKTYVLTIGAVNCNTRMAQQIPLGFRDDQYTSHSVLDEIRDEKYVEKDIKCLVNFHLSSNIKERTKCLNYFKATTFCNCDNDYFTYNKSGEWSDKETQERRKEFYRMLKRSQFVICPQGSGVDTHRFYETLFFGAKPIVKTSFLDPLYEKYEALIVNDWCDVTEEFLEKQPRRKTPPVTFITYGDTNFEATRKRIIKEAEQTGIFKQCIAYSPSDLSDDFKESHSTLLKQARGGGYWCWRYYLISKTMKNLQEDEWILWADAGCTLLDNRKNKVFEDIEKMDKANKYISAYTLPFQEKSWTKSDLFHHLNVQDDEKIINTGQFIATCFLIKNNSQMRNMIENIKNIIKHYPHLIDDTPSQITNDPSFREHRHEQSLFSIIRKQNLDMLYIIPKDETWRGNAFVQATKLKD